MCRCDADADASELMLEGDVVEQVMVSLGIVVSDIGEGLYHVTLYFLTLRV